MKKLILTIAVLVLGIIAAAQVPGGGEEFSETLDSNLQSTLIIPVSPESGLWAVTVTTETAGTFYGYCQM